MGRGLLQGIKDLVLDLRGGKADTDTDGAQIRDGVLSDAAGDLAAVDELAPGNVVAGLQRYDLVSGLQHGGAPLLRGVAGVGGYTVDRQGYRAAALAPHHQTVVREAGLEVECGCGTLDLLRHHLLGIGEHMQILLVTGKDTLDGPAGKAGGSQGLDGVDGNDKAGLHVQHAGAVGPALLIDAEGVVLGCPLLEHGVHMADEQQGGLGAAAVPLGHQYAASVLHGEYPHLGAHTLQLPAQDIVHGGHSLQLAGAALGVHHFLPERQHFVMVSIHILADTLEQFLHNNSSFVYGLYQLQHADDHAGNEHRGDGYRHKARCQHLG